MGRFTALLEGAGAKYTFEVMAEYTQVRHQCVYGQVRVSLCAKCPNIFAAAMLPLPPLDTQDPVTSISEDICQMAGRLDASALVMTAHKLVTKGRRFPVLLGTIAVAHQCKSHTFQPQWWF